MKKNLFVKIDGEYVLGEDDIVSKKDVMQELNISQSTLQRYMRQGLPFTLFENKAGFFWIEVNRWLNENGHEHIRVAAELKRKRKQQLEAFEKENEL